MIARFPDRRVSQAIPLAHPSALSAERVPSRTKAGVSMRSIATRSFRTSVIVLLAASTTACGAAPEDEEFFEEDVTTTLPQELTLAQRTSGCEKDPRVLANIVSLEVCVGADIFFRETFNGNGRTCASCHRVERNYTIDPEFISILPSKDPLFVAEFNSTLANLERPAQLREMSLILENVDGTAPDPNIRFTLRTTPHNLSMGTSVTTPPGAVTPPLDRTGWSGDGAPGQGRLTDFTNGAIGQHFTKSLKRIAGTDFRVATETEGKRVELFMRKLGRTNDLNLDSVKMTDKGAEAGRVAFLGAARCNACHLNAGANSNIATGGNRNFNTGVESARNKALAAFPRDGGFGTAPQADGSFGDGTFNSTPLVEAADTGPFFHTDTTVSGASAHNATTAKTIEQAIAFYDTPAFNNSPSGQAAPIDLTATDINNLGRFLRSVNAAFNAQMALKRLDGALELISIFQDAHLRTQRVMLGLAGVEINDAMKVLNGQSGLNTTQRNLLSNARSLIENAIKTSSRSTRKTNTEQARTLVLQATNGLGTNLHFDIGEGTLMF